MRLPKVSYLRLGSVSLGYFGKKVKNKHVFHENIVFCQFIGHFKVGANLGCKSSTINVIFFFQLQKLSIRIKKIQKLIFYRKKVSLVELG